MSATTKSLNLDAWSPESPPKPSRINLWFPDRQLLIRGPGKIAAIQLPQSAQLAAAFLLAALVLSLVLATAGLVFACTANARIARTAETLSASLAAAQAQTARVQALYVQAVMARDEALAAARSGSAAAIAQVTSESRREVAAALRERDLAIAQARQATAQAIARANQAQAANAALLNGLIRQTEATIGAVNLVFKSTGLNPDSLAAAPAAPAPGSPPALRLQADLGRLQRLGGVLGSLPLTAPTAQTTISSGFGMRASPFTGAPEFHVGIDLPGPIGAPVYATAPGTITYAGWSTGYGYLITIDHGYGLSTRYSHLNKILVKVGATVSLHQKIGLMGNTGWSTGPHLLYETRVDGQPRNPLNFIKVNPYDVQN